MLQQTTEPQLSSSDTGLGRVLLDCLSSGELTPLVNSPWAAPSSLADVVAATRFHRLDALLADLAVSQPLPEHLEAAFRAVRLKQLAQRASLAADSQWLTEHLSVAGVPWTFLKGAVTAARHHDSPLQRSYSDLDVLVTPADFERSVVALESAGARLFESNWSLVRRLGCGEINLLLPFGTLLDLHWSLIAAPHDRRAFSTVPEQVVDRRVDLLLDERTVVPAPDAADEFVHLCLHAVLGGTTSLGRWRDIALAVRSGQDWDEVVARSRTWRVGLPVAAAVERAAALLPQGAPPTPHDISRRLANGGGWLPLMRFLGARAPATSAPPASRWASHLKLTRASASASYRYAATEVLGYAVHPWYRRPRDDWDPGLMQQPDFDEAARRGYFADVAAQAAG